MSKLFDPLVIRGVTIRNRIGMSPMSMYASRDGIVGDFDLVHYSTRAIGGAGLIISGTAAVAPEGRITPADPGLWNDAQASAARSVVEAIRRAGGTAGVQIGHAGRKASTIVPWRGGEAKRDGRSLTVAEGAWPTVGPSEGAFGGDKTHTPHELTHAEIDAIIGRFGDAARLADQAGYELLELHGSHGYLMHSFYSPIANKRTDQWGGSFDNRIRLTMEIIRTVRRVWPDHKPLGLRMAPEDFHTGGWTLEDAIALAGRAHAEGVDLVDAMTFGAVAWGGDVPWAENFTRRHTKALKAALPSLFVTGSTQTAPGFATDPKAVEELVTLGDMDLVLLGRQLLAEPYWPARAATAVGDERLILPANYEHWLSGRSS